MSEFLKFAYEVLSQVVYNLVTWVAAFIRLFITGWVQYFLIFKTYFPTLNILAKILSVLLMLLLLAIPVVIIILLIRRMILHHQLKADSTDNATLYREIGRLNKQVLDLMEEKNNILALKVNAMGGVERIPYMGASALTEDTIPSLENVTGNEIPSGRAMEAMVGNTDPNKAPLVRAVIEGKEDTNVAHRMFAASQMGLYYTPEIVRRFVAGMAASKLLILEGISGTGKTSLPYSFSRYMDNPATIISVQPSFRDRSELLGYFNEFSKKFNETEFLRALYEANYNQTPTLIVLDEMNLARIEYYFAEMLSVLEMPSKDEWILDLVPTAWKGDPYKMDNGKIHVADSTWFIGTANNDDSTFTITDKVYDRAMPIELNERADEFECEMYPSCDVTAEHLEYMFQKAKEDYPISEELMEKMQKLDSYLITRFKLAFGNRIMKQLYDFIPVYVACGGTELGGMDYIIARKVLKKFESMNVSFVRDEITGLISYIDKTFGEDGMPDSKEYLRRIQNLY